MTSEDSKDVDGDSPLAPKSPSAKPPTWWRSSSAKIYICHIFSSWGDRMWGFSVALFFVILYPDSLLLTAIYGFTNCLSGIILGPYIGGWIDKTQRITAARCSVIVQNTAVVVGATVLTFTFHFLPEIKGRWDWPKEYILYAVIIIIAIVAELASVANKIALEKDWIVVLAGGDNKQLARLNSTMRTINLTTYIVAPGAVGQILHYGSPQALAIVIAMWNVISAFIEYNLLLQIYKIVPQLGNKEDMQQNEVIPFVKIDSSTPSPSSNNNNNSTPNLLEVPNQSCCAKSSKSPSQNNLQVQNRSRFTCSKKLFVSPMSGIGSSSGSEFEDVSLVTPISEGKYVFPPKGFRPVGDGTGVEYRAKEAIIAVKDGHFTCKGCRNYFKHNVRYAGLGLAALYMTVLGFDIITIGFLYSQGVHASFIGILNAIGALLGIMGSLSYPMLRNKLGQNVTGMLGFSLETVCLLLCVGSVYVGGSPFKKESIFQQFSLSLITSSTYYTHPTYSMQELWEKERHVLVLLMGIILARFGLWVADLSVTQIFQEQVDECQRGVINGVQDSLNKVMDLVKFALVILLPAPETFGYLIFISWFFILLGTLCFFNFVRNDRKRRLREEQLNLPNILVTTHL